MIPPTTAEFCVERAVVFDRAGPLDDAGPLDLLRQRELLRDLLALLLDDSAPLLRRSRVWLDE